MKCEVIHDLLDRYIDNTCSEETKRIVEEHLEECEECKHLCEQIKNVEYEVQPTISEIKPLKIYARSKKRVLFYTSIICSIALFYVLFGEAIKYRIIKYKMESYVEELYPNIDYEIKQR